MLTKTNQLNPTQMAELEQLKSCCQKVDLSVPNVYSHLLMQSRSLPSIALYYEHGLLIGFLSIYFFYEHAVEIALLIAPQARRKGIASYMLGDMLPLIEQHHYSKLIFSSPAARNNNWLPLHGFTYQHSEYYMERLNLNPILESHFPLTFRKATLMDIPQMCLLDAACFQKKPTELEARFQIILNDRNYQIILAFNKELFVGKAHLRWQKESVTLSDIAISPKLQGQGLGSSLIAHCINYCLSEGKSQLNLDVETHNQKALALYTRLGFFTQNSCDYWEINTHQLHQVIKI